MASDDSPISERGSTGWVRVAAVKTSPEQPWQVRLLEVTIGAPPPSWGPRSWVYPQAMFHGYACPTDQLLGLLCAGTVLVCEVPVDVKPFEPSIPERRRSGAHTSFEPLEWPWEERKLAIWPLGHNGQHVPDSLLSDREGDPSFLTLYDAATSFFHRPRQTAGGQLMEEAVFRAQDRTGRIDKVRMLAAEEVLEVTVAGEALDGLTLELAGPEPGPFEVLAGLDRPDRRNPHVTRFELAGGLPPNAWVVLRRGSRWIDRWFLTFPYAREGEEGVEYVPDQATRLEALVADWEHTSVEFKRQIPPKNDTDARLKLMKTVCAFANGAGGSLLVGVDDEDRSYHGIPAQAIDGLKAQLDQMVRSSVHPDPPTRFDTLPIPDSELVVLELVVEAGDTLYVCGHPKENGRAYVRHHASTEVATQPEMTQILQTRNEQEPFPVPAW